MDERERQQASQEEMNESGASEGESEEIQENIVIENPDTSGRSSTAIEIDDMENGKDLDNEKDDNDEDDEDADEEEDISGPRSQNVSAYRSPITSLQVEQDYEDDFENESRSGEGSEAGRRQEEDSEDEDNIGSVSDDDNDEDFQSNENLQNGYLDLQDKNRAHSSSTDELMTGYRDGGSVVSDMFSDFSGRFHSQEPDPTPTDSTSSPLGSKFDRLRSAYTRPIKQRPQVPLPTNVERSRSSYGYYMEPDELKVGYKPRCMLGDLEFASFCHASRTHCRIFFIGFVV